ncbi:acetylcholinesterase-1, partial [Nephila pilipes]
MRELFKDYLDPESIIKYYLPDYVPEDAYDFIRYQIYTSFGDEFFVCPQVYYAEKCAQKGYNVYYYVWRHRSSKTPWAPWMGVPHFDEVEFVFGLPLLYPSEYQTEEIQLSQKTIEIWSSFVKAG